jgi:hypothetical protein
MHMNVKIKLFVIVSTAICATLMHQRAAAYPNDRNISNLYVVRLVRVTSVT